MHKTTLVPELVRFPIRLNGVSSVFSRERPIAARVSNGKLSRMKQLKTGFAILAAATFLGTATTIAQSDVGTGGTTTVENDRPNYAPLLGLLGLFGLLGMRRRHDVHGYDSSTRP